MAGPFTMATTGFSTASIVWARCQSRWWTGLSCAWPMLRTSPPALNARPAPVSTMAPVDGSASASRIRSMSAYVVAASMALRTAGRFSVTVLIRVFVAQQDQRRVACLALLGVGHHAPHRVGARPGSAHVRQSLARYPRG